ncbi:hypothetical protein FS837_001425 [Tulasnella sp. UAMH 9824]|nr:hypothetical protein FS837_001425 [Tulasnella sp. UAMH 9824]
MFLSCYQFFLQLFLMSVQSFFTSVQRILQIVTFSKATLTASSPQCKPESDQLFDFEKPFDDNRDRQLDLETNTFLSKPSSHYLRPLLLCQKILAFINLPLLAGGRSGNKSGEPSISRHPFEVSKPIPNLTPLKGNVPAPQPVHTVLARLFSYWLKIAKVLAYAYVALQNPEIKDAEQLFDVGGMTLEVAEGIISLLPQTPITASNPSTPVSPTHELSTLSERHFIPSSPSLLGFIEEPKGRPLCAGGYSDVWRCNVRFQSPSEILPTKVAVKALRSVWLSGSGDADANEHLLQVRLSPELHDYRRPAHSANRFV